MVGSPRKARKLVEHAKSRKDIVSLLSAFTDEGDIIPQILERPATSRATRARAMTFLRKPCFVSHGAGCDDCLDAVSALARAGLGVYAASRQASRRTLGAGW